MRDSLGVGLPVSLPLKPGQLASTADGAPRDPIQKEENKWKDGTTDKIEGALHEAKGKIKEKVGKVTNDPDLEAEGQAERLSGKIQNKVGQVKQVFNK